VTHSAIACVRTLLVDDDTSRNERVTIESFGAFCAYFGPLAAPWTAMGGNGKVGVLLLLLMLLLLLLLCMYAMCTCDKLTHARRRRRAPATRARTALMPGEC
jgi:hypothetical protein